MFTTPHLPSLLKRVTFKLVEVRGSDTKARVAEVAAVIDPFTPALAHELGEDVAGHLFDEDDQPLPQVLTIGLDVPPILQRLAVTFAPDLAPEAILDEVTLRQLQVVRVEPKQGPVTYRATIALLVPLRDFEAQALARLFANTVYLTFTAHQHDLFADAKAQRAESLGRRIARDLMPEGVESLTISAPGSGRPPVTLTRDEFARASKALREA